jgi:hypothetical protein
MSDDLEQRPEPESAIERAADLALADAPAPAGEPEPAKPSARRGRGRPRGSKTRHRSRAAAPEPEPDEIAPSPAEVAAVGRMVGVGWRVLGGMMHRRPLTDTEQLELAEAAIPVLQKYGGGLAKWAIEINLAFVVYGLWITTEIPREVVPAFDSPEAS